MGVLKTSENKKTPKNNGDFGKLREIMGVWKTPGSNGDSENPWK